MNYQLINDVINLVEQFENQKNRNKFPETIDGFKQWMVSNDLQTHQPLDITWIGKDNGRSADSTISTLLVHMNRFAKIYSKAAMKNSDFSTQDEFIYLINLQAFGEMTKMELIKKNRHDKPAGMQIINRLIKQGWVQQTNSEKDKRSKLISITSFGEGYLANHMGKIRQATQIVTGDLTPNEKNTLIYLLQKLENFHIPIYENHIEKENLLDYIHTTQTK